MNESVEQFITNTPEDLEKALGELSRHEKNNGEFLEALMRSKAFTLLDRPWAGDMAAADDVRLVTVQDPQGQGRMLGLFTSAEKARAVQPEAPAFEHLARVDVLWAMLRLEDGCGVMVNPGQDTSFRIPAQVAGNLRESVRKAIQSS